MASIRKAISLGALIFAINLVGEPQIDADGAVKLYQVGKAGKYCLSITRDESGCVSGAGTDGTPINILDFIRGRKVAFENLSDAPHDMKFTGTNAEDIPPQAPQGAIVGKQMVNVDNSVSKITCSFHGDQLGVGYKVPEAKPIDQQGVPGHNDRSKVPVDIQGESGRGSSAVLEPVRPVVRTGMADVAEKALQKARPEDVARLIANRPELMGKLKEVRPLLAEELSSDENIRKVIAKAASAGAPGAAGAPKTGENGFGGIDTARQKGATGRSLTASDLAGTGAVGPGAGGVGARVPGMDNVVKTDFGTVTTYNLNDRELTTETSMRVNRLLAAGKNAKGGKSGDGSVVSMRSLASLESNSNRGLFGTGLRWYWAGVPLSLFLFWFLLRRRKEEKKG